MSEKCIWKNLYISYTKKDPNEITECDKCNGLKYDCKAYLTNKEIERREKENDDLEKIMGIIGN